MYNQNQLSYEQTAYVSNKGRYTIFRFKDTELKFIAPYSLERYEQVVKGCDSQ
jgi:hypothetical protein